MLFNCNYLYKIYYTFKKKFKYIIIIKKEKNIISNNNKICSYNNISILDVWNNQRLQIKILMFYKVVDRKNVFRALYRLISNLNRLIIPLNKLELLDQSFYYANMI